MTTAVENIGNRYYKTNKTTWDDDRHKLALFHLWRNPDLDRELYDDLVGKVSSELQQGHPIDPSKLISSFRKNQCKDDQLERLGDVVQRDRSFWEHMMQYYQQELEKRQLSLHWELSIMKDFFGLDAELMSFACIVDEELLQAMDPSLKSNRAFVRKVLLGNPSRLRCVYMGPDPDLLGCMDEDLLAEVLELDPLALQNVSQEHQRRYLHVVMEAFGQLGDRQQHNDRYRYGQDSVARSIAPDLWQNRAVLLHWFRSGLRDVEDVFDEMDTLEDDQEVLLLIAEHCHHAAHRHRSFTRASQALRANKNFMMQAVEHDAFFFGYASAALQQDFDLALLAFAAEDPALVKAYLNEQHHPNQRQFVESFYRQVQDMMGVHEAFWTLLCGMLPDSGSALTMLNQGLETSLKYKQLIATLLDVQTGEKLRLLRRAYTNLKDSRYLSIEEDDDSENDDSWIGRLGRWILRLQRGLVSLWKAAASEQGGRV